MDRVSQPQHTSFLSGNPQYGRFSDRLRPNETNPPLIIYPDTVLTFAISLQRVTSITRRVILWEKEWALFPSETRALVAGEGFEPSKATPAILQTAPFGHSGNLPLLVKAPT